MDQKHILVAYFSRKGNNYVNGAIVDLPIGKLRFDFQYLIRGFSVKPLTTKSFRGISSNREVTLQ